MSEIRYPVHVAQDTESAEFRIRDASYRVIAAHLIGRDAREIVAALNENHERSEVRAKQIGYCSYGGWLVADLDKRIKGIAEIKQEG